jgi:hypothetical protein
VFDFTGSPIHPPSRCSQLWALGSGATRGLDGGGAERELEMGDKRIRVRE